MGGSVAGLALACGLGRFGVSCTLYEEEPGPYPGGMPTTLGPRSLEALDRWGVAGDACGAGRAVRRIGVRAGGQALGWVPTSELPTRFPFLLCLDLGGLRGALEQAARRSPGVSVARGRAIVGVRVGPDRGHVLEGGGEVHLHRFLVLASRGARIRVGVPWSPGPSPPRAAWIGEGLEVGEAAEVRLGPSGQARSHPGRGVWVLEAWDRSAQGGQPGLSGLLEELDLPARARWVRVVPSEPPGQAPSRRLGILVLLGPAGVSPGLGAWSSADREVREAENLSWRLAAALRGPAPGLLDGFEREVEGLPSSPACSLEPWLPSLAGPGRVPLWGPLLRASFIRKPLAWSLSGLGDRLPPSPECLTEGAERGRALAGERCPEVRMVDGQGRRDWLQRRLAVGGGVLLFGTGARREVLVSRPGCPPEVWADPDGALWRALGARAGLGVVVRPDGVIGYRARAPRPERTEAYLATIGCALPLDRGGAP